MFSQKLCILCFETSKNVVFNVDFIFFFPFLVV